MDKGNWKEVLEDDGGVALHQKAMLKTTQDGNIMFHPDYRSQGILLTLEQVPDKLKEYNLPENDWL